jgi:hypothetical protein
VGVSLSGPTDAPVTSGIQYVTATATAGPSGVAGIACSADGAPYAWHVGANARIPFAGLGSHHVSCYAENNSIDSSGARAVSMTQTWSLSIREPTVSVISFSHLADPLRCRRIRERVKVPPHWVTVRRHHHAVRVLRRAHSKTVRVVRCRPRTERKGSRPGLRSSGTEGGSGSGGRRSSEWSSSRTWSRAQLAACGTAGEPP